MFGPTQSNRAGLRPAGAIDLLPAAMGWARRVQRLKNPGHATLPFTLRSHIAESGKSAEGVEERQGGETAL